MKQSTRKLAALSLLALLAMAPTLRAEEADSSIADEIEQMRTMMGGIAAQDNAMSKQLADMVKFSGDFRYRYEKIDTYGAPPAYAGRVVDRERYRLRLRLQADAKVNDFTKVKVRLATGSPDPVSTNQTEGGYANKKAIMLDIAEMAFENKDWILAPKFEAGKMPVPFYTPGGELIFDGDLTPEGLALGLTQNLPMGTSIKLIGAQYINDEVAGSTLDPKFEAGQVVLGWDGLFLGNPAGLTFGAAYYNWLNTTSSSTAVVATGISQNTNLTSAFSVVDYAADLRLVLAGVGTKLFYEYEKNTVVSLDDDGYIAGAELKSGKLISLTGDWLTLGYNYRVAKRESTFSPWNFSDFAGGRTDAMGHMAYGKIKIFDNTELGLTYFSDQLNLQAVALGTGQLALYERWQGDLSVKF